MNPIQVIAPLAAPALALLASTAFAQTSGIPPPSTARSNPGSFYERDTVPACVTSGGGSRARKNCEEEPTTLRTEQEFKISIEVPALPSAQCEATSSTDYHQRNTVARVNSTLAIPDCAAASGEFTVALRIRDDSGREQALEFSETWQRSDDQDVHLTADYPIGENVELLSVRVRGLRCTCAETGRKD